MPTLEEDINYWDTLVAERKINDVLEYDKIILDNEGKKFQVVGIPCPRNIIDSLDKEERELFEKKEIELIPVTLDKMNTVPFEKKYKQVDFIPPKPVPPPPKTLSEGKIQKIPPPTMRGFIVGMWEQLR